MPALPLSFALYYEGTSDRHFLPILIGRTIERVVMGRERFSLDIQEVVCVNEWNGLPAPAGAYANRVLEAARRAEGYDVLVIHRDADSSDRNKALHRYIEPACHIVKNSLEAACKVLIPIIPVRCIEAWMLADANALQLVTETNMRLEEWDIPQTPHQIEAVQKPKEDLHRLIETALGSRRRGRRGMEIGILYTGLANEINLDLLLQVNSYKQFYDDVERILQDLRIIHVP